MGYKKDDKCLQKAFDDERLFVLMTRDITSSHVVVEWIKLNIGVQPPEKLHEALDCAIEMFTNAEKFIQRKACICLPNECVYPNCRCSKPFQS